jgi:HD-like signal output (HDOD) protein
MFGWLQRLFSGPANQGGRAPTPLAGAPAQATQPRDQAQPTQATAAAPVAIDSPPSAATATSRAPVSFEQLDRVDNAWDGWLFERADGNHLDINPFEAQVLEALGAIASSQRSGAALVRRMPGLIPQLLQSLRSDGFSGAALSRTISNDVVLVAEVIRLANSSRIGTGNAITSVEHAVILIGQEGLRQLITSVAFRPIIDIQSGHYTRLLAPRLWEHAERCAVANRHLAAGMDIEPFDAFLAGLIHNVGLIVALRIMDQVAKDARELGSEVFCANLARLTRALSVNIAREWDFSPVVVQALAEQGGVKRGAQFSPLGWLTMLTDYVAKAQSLAAPGLLDAGDPSLLAGLPPCARPCYELLGELAQQK